MNVCMKIKMLFRSSVLYLFFVSVLSAQNMDDLTNLELITLARQYENGEGLQKDIDRAIVHYCHAARRGDMDAAYQLGWIYYNGRGVKLNDTLAAHWFHVAADQGDALAAKHLLRLPGITPQNEPHCLLADGSHYLEPLKTEPNPDPDKIAYWVERLAGEYNLNSALVLAVIETESNFQVAARSHKNAMGLMQLIPATAQRFHVEDVWDPLQNIQGGMAYLQWLQDYFDNSIDDILAAYNAGENVVSRYGGIPPYRETQHYVKKVKRLYQRNLNSRADSAAHKQGE